MDDNAARIICEGMRRFAPAIQFRSIETPNKVMRRALELDTRLLYYFDSISTQSMGNEYTIRPSYRHRDVPISSIKRVRSVDQCKRLLCDQAALYKKTLIIAANTGVDVKKAVHDFIEEDSTFFSNFVNVQYSYSTYDSAFLVCEFTLVYRIGYVRLAQMELEVDAAVDRISKLLFAPEYPPEVKIFLAHNYLGTTVDYVDNDATKLRESYTQSAFGALIKHECVCQGFAEAFKRLMDTAGIECSVVPGDTFDPAGRHAWNIVTPIAGGSSYHIDVTWDRARKGGKLSYSHFCISDAAYEGKRAWKKEYFRQCKGSYPILAIARRYVQSNKAKMLARGIDASILDC